VSAEAMNWAKRQKVGGPGPKAVLMALADYADERHSCHPGQALLAEITEQSERTVRGQLALLESAGLLRREPRFRTEGRGRTSDRYFLAVDQPEESAGSVSPTNRQPPSGGTTTNRQPGARLTGKSGTTNRQAVAAQEPKDRSEREPKGLSPILVDATPAPADAFDAFWTAYPRKVGKGAARKAWPKALKAAGGNPGRIIAGAVAFAVDPNREAAFTPHPATWLNAERWDDEPLPARQGRASSGAANVPRGWAGIAEARAMRGAR
jgi:hypothetical protein